MDGSPQAPIAREMRGWELLRSRLYYAWQRWRARWLPHLVWAGQEVEVVVTFTEARLPEMEIRKERDGSLNAADVARAFRPLNSGVLPSIKGQLGEIGVTFDTGLGVGGMDWEWDYSLKGPISVKFKRVRRAYREGRG